jgi:hypothetical protein
LNPQPLVLETSALPIELQACKFSIWFVYAQYAFYI